jgi:hypothetical protein
VISEYISNRFAIYCALIVSVVRIIYIYLVSRSITTIIISFPSEIGSFVIKSIVIYSYSRFSTSANSNSLYSTYYSDLFR